MTDISAPTPTPAPAPPPAAPPPPPATPWHAGVEPEVLGHWQNKGWKIDDPKEIALAATKQAREAEKYFGVPADQLLKMPKPNASEADIKAFWQRLGAAEAKDYDLSSVKFNNEPLEESFVASMREALATAFVPKDKAPAIAAAVVKYLEGAEAAETAITTAKITEEKAKLAAEWRNNYDSNVLKAREGARRLGISPEAIVALENQIGYAAVMEAMRKIGVATSEHDFVEGAGPGGIPSTQSGAVARKGQLMADNDWVGRYLRGGATERREMDALNQLITGVVA